MQIKDKWYVREQREPVERWIENKTHGPYESEEMAKCVMEQFQGSALGTLAQMEKEKMEI